MLIIRKIRIPALSKEPRRLFIYLPEEASEDEERRFPVLYMFDGHNVFLDETASYGKSWGMTAYLEKHHVPVIVVGIECNHEGNRRLEEYSPYDFGDWEYGPIRGQGKITMNWICQKLKPAIDKEFPTLPDREHTCIAGSSMGGLMTVYALSAYNRVFSRGAALSPSLYVGDGAITATAKRSRILPGTRLYMDMGSEEMGDRRAEVLDRMDRLNRVFLRKGADTTMRVVTGGNHSEASWEKQIPVFMNVLGLEEPELQEPGYMEQVDQLIDETGD